MVRPSNLTAAPAGKLPGKAFARRRRGAACALLLLSVAWSAPGGAADNSLLDQATLAEQSGNYAQARIFYQSYIESRPDAAVRQSLTLRISVLDEVNRYGPDAAVPLFFEALSARDKGDYDLAISHLKSINTLYPASYLNDDALYLIGYIGLLDMFDFVQAHDYLRRLLEQYPNTRYVDTALYSEAIALEQLGNTQGAKSRFMELRARHTEFSVGFLKQYWPRGNLISRYWFDRANRRLNILNSRAEAAAVVVERRVLSEQSQTLRVLVDVDGMDLVLLLRPSSVTQNAVLKDRNSQPIAPVRTRFFTGVVDGDHSSWARVAITGNAIEGVVSTVGLRYVLAPDTLIGTIDYYQPKRATAGDHQIQMQDYVIRAPEADVADTEIRRALQGTGGAQDDDTDISKLARVSIVVDSQYNDYYGGNGLVRALSVLNVADGIYREEFGLALELGTAIVFADRQNDPMNLGSVTLEQSLRGFRDYRMTEASVSADTNLVYLFSGNQNTDEAIGLAWIGGACRVDGYDVGVTTPSVYGDLLMAHELGHSLGAQHDSDTACVNEANQLMWPRISAMTQQDFTSCSRESVTPSLVYGCYTDTLDLSLALSLVGDSTLNAVIRNNDHHRTAVDTRLTLDHTAVDFDSIPGQCFATSNAELECRTGEIAPGGEIRLSFALGPMNGTSMTVLAELSPIGFADVYNADNSVQLDAIKTADGNTDITIASVEATVTGGASAQAGPAASMVESGSAGGVVFWLLLPTGLMLLRRR